MSPAKAVTRPLVGLALGSGSARGWAHIGVIEGLEERGIVPDIVCGSSIGALVGGAYCAGHLETLRDWVCTLTWRDVMRYMDVTLAGGGLIQGERLMAFFRRKVEDRPIEALARPFAAVATDLATGREVWLQSGLLMDAVRASIALPGLFTPVLRQGRWLVDGGVVNPVPVSLCRAMGADLVIAVDLNGDIVGKHLANHHEESDMLAVLLARLPRRLRAQVEDLLRPQEDTGPESPGVMEVVAGAINIMQDRITRSRMAGDPPTVRLAPRLAHIELLAFDRAREAIAEGRACVQRMRPVLDEFF